jgi:ABC-type glutathione transport system ATPase component
LVNIGNRPDIGKIEAREAVRRDFKAKLISLLCCGSNWEIRRLQTAGIVSGKRGLSMSNLTLSNLFLAFGATHVLRDVSLSVRDCEFLTLAGASGCDKSTALWGIAGRQPQEAGTDQIGGREADHLHPKQRNVEMVVQSDALYPSVT